MFQKFNINHKVKVRLTDLGRESHRNKTLGLLGPVLGPRYYKSPEEDDQGWSKWQMWELMSVFGDYVQMGFNPPFEPEIMIDIEDEE